MIEIQNVSYEWEPVRAGFLSKEATLSEVIIRASISTDSGRFYANLNVPADKYKGNPEQAVREALRACQEVIE
jgi:hypothetical protein